MVVVIVVAVLLFVVWRVRRARRAAVLAGLSSVKPTFSVEPPRRRVGSRKWERL